MFSNKLFSTPDKSSFDDVERDYNAPSVSDGELTMSDDGEYSLSDEDSKELDENNNSTPIAEENKINIIDVAVTSENVALNILVTFVNLAQKRGAFDIRESAKIWECIQKFNRN